MSEANVEHDDADEIAVPHVKRRVPTALAGVALAVAVLAGSHVAVAGAKVAKGPAGDAFYDPPKEKRFQRGPGRPIWQRQATGIVPLGSAASTKLLLHTSKTPRSQTKSGQSKRIAVSGSVSVPEGRPPKKGWPLISYAHGTTGVADRCAPTRVAKGSAVAPFVTYADPQLEEWLEAGYAIARTDYPGLGTPGRHPYLIGKSEGRGVVDIAAAARKLYPRIGKRYLIAGHSQGGHAALFAAAVAERNDRGMKLRGTASYAPVSHLLEQLRLLPSFDEPSPLSAEAVLILAGASTASKGVGPGLLSAQAQSLYPQVMQVCLPQLQRPTSYGGIAPADLLREGADLTAFERVLGRQNPAVRTSKAIFLAQGTADTTVFPFLTDQLDSELTALGDDVTYVKYEDVTHGEVVAAAEADALSFLRSKLPAR